MNKGPELTISVFLICIIILYCGLVKNAADYELETSNKIKYTQKEEMQMLEDKSKALINEMEEIETEIEPDRLTELEAELEEWIVEYSYSKNISPFLVLAIIEKESECKSNAIGDGGESIGLMQINRKWHLDRMLNLNITDLTDSKQNIITGIDYLLELFKKNPDAEWVLNAYNGGNSYANEKMELNIETEYSKEILTRAAELERSWSK